MLARSWVLVASDFVRHGGMDRANYELAFWLAREGARVDLVGHRIDDELAAHANVVAHRVPRPLGADLLGNALLAPAGMRVARARVAAAPETRVVVNGGNCPWPDANWVHAVHRAWPVRDSGAKLPFRVKNRIGKWSFLATERLALSRARVVLANSEKTRRELVTLLGVSEERVRVVYLGCDPAVDRPLDRAAVEARRAELGVAPGESMVVFVGALGSDRNKGLDTLLDAWGHLRAAGRARRHLLVAGRANPMWQREIAARGLEGDVRLLGFRRDVGDIVGAADLMVAPSRYDSYGLAVQEALCREVAVLVSARAGVAERYPAALASLILPDPEDARDLAAKVTAWERDRARLAPEVAKLGELLRRHDWPSTARELVAAIESPRPTP